MRTSKKTSCRVSIAGNWIFFAYLTIASGIFPALFLCTCSGPVHTNSEEQSSFTAADTFDITTLATTLQPGKIQSIGIYHIQHSTHIQHSKPTTASTVAYGRVEILAPLSSHAVAYFEPEVVQPSVKRYYSVMLSNISWPESNVFKKDTSRIIRNNWITSKNNLFFYDKTVLNLDSCTIEVTLSDANIDTVVHLLNRISAGHYEYDSTVFNRRILNVNKITGLRWVPESDVANVSITCSGSTIFSILYKNGVIRIKMIDVIML